MTIRFNCPKCKSLIAFGDKHAGKSAHCLTCGQKLIIPAETGQKAKPVEPKVEIETPQPGFYHAVFIDSWKLFLDKDNLTAIVFVTAAVCFKFFSAAACCLGHVMYFIAWGYLLGFYLKIICSTAFGEDKLPEIELGISITFLWYIFKPLLVFVFTLCLVELPFFSIMAISRDHLVTFEELWRQRNALNLLLISLFLGGLFIFPMAILTIAVIEDYSALLRPDRILGPIFKAFVPYLVVVAILVAVCLIETNTRQYAPMDKMSLLSTAANLAVNLTGQVVAIITMRSIGLFYRHYGCYFNY